MIVYGSGGEGDGEDYKSASSDHILSIINSNLEGATSTSENLSTENIKFLKSLKLKVKRKKKNKKC